MAMVFTAVWFVAAAVLALAMSLLTLFVTDATVLYVWPTALAAFVPGGILIWMLHQRAKGESA